MNSNLTIKLVRWSLGLTFLWFGALKLFNASPVLPIIKRAMPEGVAESQLFFIALSLLEIGLGLAFLSNKFVKLAAIIMIGHLIVATCSVLFTQGFDPRFPVLSLPGEFVLKNLVIIAAGLTLLSYKNEKPDPIESKNDLKK